MCTALLFAVSCTNDEHFEPETELPPGWDMQEQTIVIEGKAYDIVVMGNPNGPEIEFVDPPQAVQDFFVRYDSTLIPHVLFEDAGMVVYYYKDWQDFEDKVKFIDSKAGKPNKSYLGGHSISWQHHTGGSYGGYGNYVLQNMTWYKNYYFGSTTAYGYSHSSLGSMNDEISAVTIQQYDFSEWITYMGCRHSDWGGKRVVITKTSTNIGDNTALLWLIKFGLTRSWNDRISSCETWQSMLYVSGRLVM